jgi:uracil-DNA glycosylase
VAEAIVVEMDVGVEGPAQQVAGDGPQGALAGPRERRLHEKPNAREIAACRPWLEAELALLEPDVLVCLGAEETRHREMELFVRDLRRIAPLLHHS